MHKKIRVAHDLKDFDEGEEVILTLKDQSLIKGNDLNEEMEELENTQLRERGQTEYNNYLRENIKKLAHAETSHLQYKLEGQTEKTLLPHYDEHKYKKDGFTIEQEDNNDNFKAPKAITEEIRQQKEQQSLMLKQNRLASEYQQSEKKLFKPRKVDKSKNTRELINFLQETAEDDEDERDSRKRAAEQLIEDLDVVRKRRNFDKAVEKAQQTNKRVQERMRQIEDYEVEMAMRKKKKPAEEGSQGKVVANILQSNAKQPEANSFNTVEFDLDPLKFAHPGQPSARHESQLNMKDARGGMTSVLNICLPSQRLAKKEQSTVLAELPQKFEDIPQEQLERMKQEIAFMQEGDVGVGLSGTLKYLRQNGMTGQEEYVGRSRDKKPTLDQSEDRVKLEYRDASGRLMTPKEAFRYMCWIFHGEGPGKNKIEKRKRREVINQRARMTQPGQSTTMRLLKEHQKKSDEPHMVFGRHK